MGYLPSRGLIDYSFSPFKVNCLGHACFNFTDKILKEISEEVFFYHIPSFRVPSEDVFTEDLSYYLKAVGLKISPCEKLDILKSNEWKVALYFSYELGGITDYHFMLQEKDGHWSSKQGWHSQYLDFFKTLPEVYDTNYKLFGVYKISNPYAKKENEVEQEK